MQRMDSTDARRWVKPAVASAKFGVSPQAIRAWAKAGKVTSIRTLGGHRRYDEDEVAAMVDQSLQVAS
jgi:DNA-binding transcriptional MerR regulator